MLVPINPKYVQSIFNNMAYGKSHFDQQDFMRYMKQNPDSLQWFSKPEKALKSRINEYVT